MAYAVVPLADKLNLRWSVRDLDTRSQLITGTLQETLTELLEQDNKTKINQLFVSTIRDERLFTLAFCFEEGKML